MDSDKLLKMIEDAVSEVGGAVVGGLTGAAIGEHYGEQSAAAGAAIGAGAGTLVTFIFKKLSGSSSDKTYTESEIRDIVDREIIARNSGR